MDLVNFSGSRILVTGASSGIGQAVALMAAELGSEVLLLSRDEEKLMLTAEKIAGNNWIFPFDLLHTDQISGLIDGIIGDLGPISGLVHCAGTPVATALQGVKSSLFNKAMSLHVYSFLEMVKQIQRRDGFKPQASVVAISSVAATQGSPGHTVYSSAKAALEASVRCLAIEFADKDVRFNCVSPGVIDTPFSRGIRGQAKLSEGARQLIERQYLGIGKPEDVASAVMFLMSGASRFITGSSLPVDGGRLSS